MNIRDDEMETKYIIDLMMHRRAEEFAKESNQIEGDYYVTEDQLSATLWVLENGIHNVEALKHVHFKVTSHLDVDWRGKWRNCQVYVGKHIPPAPKDVPKLMEKFFKDLKKKNSFTAHCEYEAIHPFTDFNGRTGRLLWLSKAVHNEGFKMTLPFLHKFYYQTLDDFEKRNSMLLKIINL